VTRDADRTDPVATADDAAQRRAEQAGRQMMATDHASNALGIQVSDIAPGRAVARMPVTENMINGHGIGHGGYVFLLADTAFAVACNTAGPVTVAAGADISFVAPARLGDELTADAVERTRYGRSGVYDVTVRRADGAVVAEFRGRSRTLAKADPPGPAAATS
jgi:acyl-CoA thioesterase